MLRARGDDRVASLTLLTTMLDFSDPGDLGVFIDEAGRGAARADASGEAASIPARELGFVFQTLRANDLIWPYVVNNYLKGRSPPAFDLLYWNADSTNLPGPMYAWYLRNMYLENNLCKPGRLTMCGTPVDLGTDRHAELRAGNAGRPHRAVASARIDRRNWWAATTQFVLGASGHIAGVINPASKNKRSFWTGGELGDDPEAWLATAKSQPGSWWTHWIELAQAACGQAGQGAQASWATRTYKPIEPAPGRYVTKHPAGSDGRVTGNGL